MRARLKRLFDALREAFWLVPALMTLTGILLGPSLVWIDASGRLPQGLIASAWLYNGGGTGARTLLGAIASSTIGVVGTVFSITIAALSLAAGQMGPRLLRNFTRDRGNQITLGAFLGTFSYALMVLRTVRTEAEGGFVPHLSLTVGILLAFACVGTLVYFVGHMANRINVDTVIVLVSEDVRKAVRSLAASSDRPLPPPESFWRDAIPVADARRGYLLHLDESGLAQWAAEKRTVVRLLVRPGDHVFPGAPIALMKPLVAGVEDAIRDATALSAQRGSSADIDFAVRQLVEVAVRALSPGINDPHTAMSAIDCLGAALCELAPLRLSLGALQVGDRVALVVPSMSYDSLVDAMFHMIRQNGAGSPAVLSRIVGVLTAVAGCEQDPARVATLRRHVDLVLNDASRNIGSPADLADLRRRRDGFDAMLHNGAVGHLLAMAAVEAPS